VVEQESPDKVFQSASQKPSSTTEYFL